jgi:PAS domain S-box-containing protein
MTAATMARRVLIVEDDNAMAELERQALSRAGFTPHVASSVAEARQQLLDSDFAACLLDYSLPDGDAWSVVALTRGLRPRVPVIIATAMGSETIAAEAVRQGVAEYLPKSERFVDGLGAAVGRVVRLAEDDEETRGNNALFRTIADNAHDAIVLLDRDGMILFASAVAESMLGDTPDALIGRSLADFIHPEDRIDWPCNGRAPPRRGEVRQVYRFPLRDGQVASIEPTFVTIGEGDAMHTLGVLRDVTERVRLEERARHQERMEAIGRLTGGLAHDFNNLLAVVIGNLDVLRAQSGTSELVHELAQDALDAALFGADLTGRLLAFARRQDLRPTHLDVNESIRSITSRFDRVLGGDISVELRLAENVWPVSIDHAHFETALTNLAANARDAMPRGGRLVITTRNAFTTAGAGGADAAADAEALAAAPPGGYALIEVTDTGVGIPPDELGRVFEPFYTTKVPGRGTGLGLSMVFGFVRQSGGHIHADSEVGRGTTFRLYFPRAAAPADAAAAPSWTMSPAPGGDGRTILVVEDNEQLRRLTARRLEAAQYRVLVAEDAAAAMATIHGAEAIDLLFTDIMMPDGINGHDLARHAAARRPAMRILLTSGLADLHGDADGARRSPYRLLHKPYRSDALLHAVRATLDGE